MPLVMTDALILSMPVMRQTLGPLVRPVLGPSLTRRPSCP